MADDENVLDVVVEIPRGSRNKYEFDEQTGVLRLDRRLTGSLAFPADYGFVPGTKGRDQDRIDALVLCDEPTFPGVHVTSRVIGGIRLTYEGTGAGQSDVEVKLITVPVSDPSSVGVYQLSDLPDYRGAEIEQFFSIYSSLGPGANPETTEQLDAAAAMSAVRDAQERAS